MWGFLEPLFLLYFYLNRNKNLNKKTINVGVLEPLVLYCQYKTSFKRDPIFL